MDTTSGTSLPASLLFAGIVALVLVAVVVGLVWRRRAARSVPRRLREAGEDLLTSFLIPNADSGQIHIDFAVLTRQGIVIVDVRDVAGHVFGSETMQDWTVLASDRRFTFSNPLPALYDRVAAVKRLLPEMPVRGVVAFSARAEFSKGFPPRVALLESLLTEIAAARATSDGPPQDQLRAAWDRLRQEATPNRAT